VPGEGWQTVWEGGKFTEGMSSNAQGEVFFNDVPNSKTYKIALDGKITEFVADSHKSDGQAFGPDASCMRVPVARSRSWRMTNRGRRK